MKGNSKSIKKEINFKELKILLYHYKINSLKRSKSNIEAFDQNNNLIWIAELPTSGLYYEMQFDETNDTIEANDGGGMHYIIELTQGKIVDKMLIK